jgi:hypothetical protein
MSLGGITVKGVVLEKFRLPHFQNSRKFVLGTKM